MKSDLRGYSRSSVRAGGTRGAGADGVASASRGGGADGDSRVADNGGRHAGGVGDGDHRGRVAGLLRDLGAHGGGRVGSSLGGGRGRVTSRRHGSRAGRVAGDGAVGVGRGGRGHTARDRVDGARGDSRSSRAVRNGRAARSDSHKVGGIDSASGHGGTSEEDSSSETHLEGIGIGRWGKRTRGSFGKWGKECNKS